MKKIKIRIQRFLSSVISVLIVLGSIQIPTFAAPDNAGSGTISETLKMEGTKSIVLPAGGTIEYSLNASLSGVNKDASAIYKLYGEEENMVSLGLDRLVFTSQNGEQRFMNSSEYDLNQVTVPQTEPARNYRVYYAKSLDTAAKEYVTETAYYGNSGSEQTFILPEGTKAAYVAFETLQNGKMEIKAEITLHSVNSGSVTACSYLYDKSDLFCDINGYDESYNDLPLQDQIRKSDEKVFGTAVLRSNTKTTVEYVQPSTQSRVAPTNYLNGWNITAEWTNGSSAYVWNASEDDTQKPTLVVSYRHENADQDYAPGDLSLTIPGIGKSKRNGFYMMSSTAGSGMSEWNSTYNSSNDTYTFRNLFSIKKGQSVSGGFQLAWTVNARESIHDYAMNSNPVFTIRGVDSINLPALSYQFTSTTDLYRIKLEYDTNIFHTPTFVDGWESFKWNASILRYDKDLLSRGLKEWKTVYTITLPTAVDEKDIRLVLSTGEVPLKKVSSTIYTYTAHGTEEILGDDSSEYAGYTYIGLRDETVLKDTVTLSVHLQRKYHEEDSWIMDARTNEKVRDQVTMTLYTYEFNWNGYIYDTIKETSTYQRYETEGSHEAPAQHKNRLYIGDIFNNKEIDFTLYGYASTDLMTMTLNEEPVQNKTDYRISTDNNAIREDDSKEQPATLRIGAKAAAARDTSVLFGAKYPAAPGNTSGITKLKKYDTWYTFLADDKLAVVLKDGSIRNLTDQEYDITYVTPMENNWEVYAAKTQDAAFDSYELIRSGKEGYTRVELPDGYKAVIVLYKNQVNGSDYEQLAEITIKFHLDWTAEEGKASAKQVDPEQRIINFNLFRAMYNTGNGTWANDCALTNANYGGTYGTLLAARDKRVHNEYFLRDYSHVWLRNIPVRYYASADIAEFTETAEDQYESVITASGHLKAEETGLKVKQFSLYSEVPAGLKTKTITKDSLTFASSAIKNHAKVENYEVNGKQYVAVHFDYSTNPIDISALKSFSFSYKVYENGTNLQNNAHKYTSYSYIMIDDAGPKSIKGAIKADHYDIDRDGDTSEVMGYGSDVRLVQEGLDEWRQYIEKHVKSYYSSDYVTSSSTKIYRAGDSDAEKEKSRYSYRLTFALGSNGAKNLVFYDSIENGARIAQNADTPDVYNDIPTEWNGSFASVDTSYAEGMGFVPTIYYSVDANAPRDLADSTWSTIKPDTVRAIAVKLDASGFANQVFSNKDAVYVIVNMQAPSDESLTGKLAVNQYYVSYDSYNPATGASLNKSYTLPSSETYLELIDVQGRMEIIKTSAKTGEPIEGVSFQIYDAGKNLIYSGIRTDAAGKISLDLNPGTYYWEEKAAAEGYKKIEGLHEFLIQSGETTKLEIKNEEKLYKITIDKELLENYEPYGEGTFLYQISCVSGIAKGKVLTQVIHLKDMLEGNVIVSDLPAGTYEVRELATSRFGLVRTENVTGFTILNNIGTAELRDGTEHAEIKFTNNIMRWDKFSHNTFTLNSIKKKNP